MTELVAVAQLAMHSREHVVILRPGGRGLIAHTMFFGSEVRADEEYTADTKTVTQKELNMAQTLIHSLETSFQPAKYRDTYRERLESIIARRVAGQPVAIPEKPSPTASVVDITEALQKNPGRPEEAGCFRGAATQSRDEYRDTPKETVRLVSRGNNASLSYPQVMPDASRA